MKNTDQGKPDSKKEEKTIVFLLCQMSMKNWFSNHWIYLNIAIRGME